VDGKVYDPTATFMYKGMMLSDVPNFAFTMGYSNASWTLKADLVSAHVCAILRRMENKKYDLCCPRRGESDGDDAEEDFFGLTSGYLLRAQDRLPKQVKRERKGEEERERETERDIETERHRCVLYSSASCAFAVTKIILQLVFNHLCNHTFPPHFTL
jgi:hypothetical protein